MVYVHMCVLVHTLMCARSRGHGAVLLYHFPSCSTETGSLVEPGASLAARTPPGYRHAWAHPAVSHGFCDAANALPTEPSPDSPLLPFLPLPGEPADTWCFLLGGRGYPSSQPRAHTGTAARPAHPIWEHRGSDGRALLRWQ